MAKITVEELFYGDKYGVMGEVVKQVFARQDEFIAAPHTFREIEIVRQTLIAVEKMKKNGDCIAEGELGDASPFLYAEVLMKTLDELWYGMDIKTLSAMIGHVSAEMTLNIYSHITDTMQQQAAVRIDREIGGTDAQMPEPEPPKASEPTPTKAMPEKEFEPYKGKIGKSGTGCVTMINDHLYEGGSRPPMPMVSASRGMSMQLRERNARKSWR